MAVCTRNPGPGFKTGAFPGFRPRALLLPVLLALTGRAAAGDWEIGYSFDAPSSQTNGLTWDGQALWHTNDSRSIIYRINPDGGAVLDTYPSEVPDQGDAEFGGGFLWVVSETAHYIHKVDPSSGETVDTIKVLGIRETPPGARMPIQIEGCTFDGRNLWVSGDSTSIVRIDLVKRTQHLYKMPGEWGYLDGLTWAFDHLWIATNNATLFEIDPCTMGVLDRFDAPANVGGGPEGFAFDGENLWFADNDLDQIYKIILKDKILTKRAAPARAGCDEGVLLTAPPVSLGHAYPRRGAFPASRPRASAVFAGKDGTFGDALGRALPDPLPSRKVR